MKKLVLVLTVVLVLSGIFAVAALTEVVIDREITATVASDIDDDVAVKFTVGDGYGDVADVDGTSGKIRFNLDGVLTGGDGESFNTHAEFTIGAVGDPSATPPDPGDEWVFSITNQTTKPITVTVHENTGGGITLMDASTGLEWVGNPMASGDEEHFYFELNTADVLTTGAPVNADYELRIRLE